MKDAVRLLVIIAAVIGIIWSIVGFIGILFGGAFVAAGQEAIGKNTTAAEATETTTVNLILMMIGSFIAIIIGLIFGIISSNKETKRIRGIILSLLLLFSGIIATICASYVAGPIYILCGILALISNSTSKQLKKKE
ncbi:MAG TPA: hypothetical protein PLG79_13580 [Spirochaetales bacterium]|nr:hypothetical protein [Spirochaetales bacterium]